MNKPMDSSRSDREERCRHCGQPLFIRYNWKEAIIECKPCGYRYEDIAAECELAALAVQQGRG